MYENEMTVEIGDKITVDGKNRLHSFNDLPAILAPDGIKYWFEHGKFHRTTRPAITEPNGKYHWFIKGKQYCPNKEFQEAANLTDDEMIVIILKY
jgi:hypothetical protein